jgi:hypothetical protein
MLNTIIFFSLLLLLIILLVILRSKLKSNQPHSTKSERLKAEKEEKRIERKQEADLYFAKLEERFGLEIADKIKNEKPWIEMTPLQLVAMIGNPDDIKHTQTSKSTTKKLIYKSYNSSDRMVYNSYSFIDDKLFKIDANNDVIKVWEKYYFKDPLV